MEDEKGLGMRKVIAQELFGDTWWYMTCDDAPSGRHYAFGTLRDYRSCYGPPVSQCGTYEETLEHIKRWIRVDVEDKNPEAARVWATFGCKLVYCEERARAARKETE